MPVRARVRPEETPLKRNPEEYVMESNPSGAVVRWTQKQKDGQADLNQRLDEARRAPREAKDVPEEAREQR
jgi:hypothetical protein